MSCLKRLNSLCPFCLTLFLLLLDITTKRAAARIVGKEIANIGDPPQDNQDPPESNQIPPQQQVPLSDQAPDNPLAMPDGDIRSSFLSLSQAITS